MILALSLLSLMSFPIRRDLIASALPGDDSGPGSPSMGSEEETQIPMPYIAARRDEDQDSSDIIDDGSAGIRTRVRYKPILFSALLPGSGQLYQGQERGYVYLAAEVASITGWVLFRNKGGDVEEEYIQYAWDNARLGQSSRNVRGDDEYYEHMARWYRSGYFDQDDHYDLNDLTTVSPQSWEEGDTWNGEQWRIATINYGEPDTVPGGDYILRTAEDSLAALQYYVARAYQNDFLWDWSINASPGAGEVRVYQNKYLDLRDESNLAFQRATISLIVLMANHAISVIDAFMSARVELPGEERESRTRLDIRMKRGSTTLPGATVRLTHKF